MPRSRFVAARDVFEAFPGAAAIIGTAASDEPVASFLETLLAGPTPEDAVAFAAFALGRREAVWWAARSVRLFGRIAPGQEDAPLGVAEGWVRDPEDGRRREALRLGMAGDPRLATTWVALAAGWSGGNIAPGEQGYVPAGPEMTPKAARTAILVALAQVSARERGSSLAASIEAAAKLMVDDAGSR